MMTDDQIAHHTKVAEQLPQLREHIFRASDREWKIVARPFGWSMWCGNLDGTGPWMSVGNFADADRAVRYAANYAG